MLVMQEIALSDNRQHLDELPARARETLLSVVAAYIPYYNPPQVIVMAGSTIIRQSTMGQPCVWCTLTQLPRLSKVTSGLFGPDHSISQPVACC